MARNSRLLTHLRRAGLAVAALLLILVLTLSLIDWNVLKQPIERVASARSGREVRIAGKLDVDVWSWTPSVRLNGLRLGNPPWEAARPMAQVERVQLQLKLLPLLKGEVILPRVELVRPVLYLHRDPSGRANWTFRNTRPTEAPAAPPGKLPVVRDFLIQSGRLTIVDDIRRLKVEGTVQAHEKGAADDPQAFRIQGKGTINDEPFILSVMGGPLVNLDPDHPYPFDLEIEAGNIRVASNGIVRKPFDLGQLNLNVRTSGSDLADLFYLTQLALPNSPPFKLQASLERNGSQVRVSRLDGSLGRSDISGQLSIDLSRKRPRVSGDLVSKQLRLRDLVASVGGRPESDEAAEPRGASGSGTASRKSRARAADAAPPAKLRLFPTAHLQVDRVRAMDGDVHFRARAIQAGTLPLKEVAFHVKLEDGVLRLDPFVFEMPQGHLRGTASIDARRNVPETRIDVRASDIHLEQFKGKAPGATAPLGGIVQARAVFAGRGDSVHKVLSAANGRLTLILPHGEVRSAFAELTGINVARGLGLLLQADEERAEVRCGVAQFAVQQGTMHAENFVFDTENVRITGRGEIRLGPEELDLAIKGEPKKLRLARIRTPIEINGHLLKPSIGIGAGKVLKQGAIATALATVITPLAAVIAFVDPGLAEDENCAALLSSAQPAAHSGSQR